MRSSKVDKNGMKQGAWSADEDRKLMDYISRYRIWNWGYVAKYSGLSRNGKSCRLRWVNYLNPDIKRGNITKEEEQIIVDMYAVMGSKWSSIAKRLPGRTDNEIKNYWYTRLKKKQSDGQNSKQRTTEPPHTVEIATSEDISVENSSDASTCTLKRASSAASEASNSAPASINMIQTTSPTTSSEVSNSTLASINMILTTSATTSSEVSNPPTATINMVLTTSASTNSEVSNSPAASIDMVLTMGVTTCSEASNSTAASINLPMTPSYVNVYESSGDSSTGYARRLNNTQEVDNADTDHHNSLILQTFGEEFSDIWTDTHNCTGNTYTENDHQFEADVQEWPLCLDGPFNSDEYWLNDDNNLPDVSNTSLDGREMPSIQDLPFSCTRNMYTENNHIQLEASVQEWPLCSYGPFNSDEYWLNDDNNLPDVGDTSLDGREMPSIQYLPFSCTRNMYTENNHIQLEASVQEWPVCSYGPFNSDEYRLNDYHDLPDVGDSSMVGSEISRQYPSYNNCTGNIYDHQLEACVQEWPYQEEQLCSYYDPVNIDDEYRLNDYNYLPDVVVPSMVGSSAMPNIQYLP